MQSPLRTRSALLLLATVFAFTLAAASARAQVSPGHRLYGPQGTTDTFLMDNQGNVVHQWSSAAVVGITVYMKDDGNLFRTYNTTVGNPGAGGGIQEIALDGTVLWDYHYDTGGVLAHHDIEPLPNGNVLMIAWEEKTVQEAIDAGRDPATVAAAGVLAEHLVEIQPTGPTTGNIVWEWHVWDHLIQDFDPTKANFGDPAAHPELFDVNFPGNIVGELNHFNGVDYDRVNDLIIVSGTIENELWILDHSTTTAESAGHTGGTHGKGGDLLWRWGNPAAYRAGTAADQVLFKQHCPKFIDAGYPASGDITLFNNQNLPQSEIWELVLPKDANGNFFLEANGTYGPAAPVWVYADAGLDSPLMSSAERLPNGNTLICSSLQGRLFEIDPAGTIVWEEAITGGFSSPFHMTYVERTFWTDKQALSAAAGGTVAMEMVEGADRANHPYLVVGTFSGTAPGTTAHGVHVPINRDRYTQFTIDFAGDLFLPGTTGVLDALGRGSAALDPPPGAAAPLIGRTLHHAAVIFDPTTGRVVDASQAIPLFIDA